MQEDIVCELGFSWHLVLQGEIVEMCEWRKMCVAPATAARNGGTDGNHIIFGTLRNQNELTLNKVFFPPTYASLVCTYMQLGIGKDMIRPEKKKKTRTGTRKRNMHQYKTIVATGVSPLVRYTIDVDIFYLVTYLSCAGVSVGAPQFFICTSGMKF